MKSGINFFIILMFLLFSTQVKAEESITSEIYFDRAGLKLVSGVVNVFTGWMELPKNIGMWRQKNESELTGITEGVLRGLVHTASRTASGAVDVITFWLPTFPTPSPLYVWDDYSAESKYHAFRTGD